MKQGLYRHAAVILLVFCLLVPFNIPRAGSAAAGSWYVAPVGDDANDCASPASPCASITRVLGLPGFGDGDTVYVAEGVYTAAAGKEVVALTKNASLFGGWNADFDAQVGLSTLDANPLQNSRRVITVPAGITAAIDRFVFQNGLQSCDMPVGSQGAGIYNKGTLTVTNSIVQNNRVGYGYCETGSGAGIYNAGTLTLNRSTVRNNSTLDSLSDSGGGIFNDGGALVLNSSAVIHNTAGGSGGGIQNSGILIINNSTVSGNRAGSDNLGGGIANYSQTPQKTTISSSTITNNIGAGLLNGMGNVSLQNTLLAGNFDLDGVTVRDCNTNSTGATITSLGYNLIGRNDGCDPPPAAGDLLDADTHGLFGLNEDSGAHPIARNSFAVNAGNPDGCKDDAGNLLPTDQRGQLRYGRCDIGAYEFQPDNDPLNYCLLGVVERRCEALFSDNFSNPASGWYTFSLIPSEMKYLNGEFQLLVKWANYYVDSDPDFQAENYIVAVDLRNASGVAGSYGLAFGVEQNWNNLYSFEIYPDGWLGVYRYDQSLGTYNATPVTLAEGYSPAIHQGSASNRIVVERSGASIKAYANGQLLASLSDDTYSGSRYIGLLAFSYEKPNLDVRFDNFVVHRLACASEILGKQPLSEGLQIR